MDDFLRRTTPPLVIASLLWLTAIASEEKHTVTFEIQAGDIRETVLEWSRQSNMGISYALSNSIDSTKTRRVSGAFEPLEALRRMLKGTGMKVEYSEGSRSVSLLYPEVPVRSRVAIKPVSAEINPQLSEVVIATQRLASDTSVLGEPVVTYDRVYIDSTHALSMHDVLSTIPQVFGGGPQEYVQAGYESQLNSMLSSGVNLRGLDAGAALVLWDGVRLAGSGTRAEFADISMVPLAMIDHIDIIADGPCTRCGSDAVSGVVSIVSRHLTGVEAQVRTSDATQGSPSERQASVLGGNDWSSGSADWAFEYWQRSALASKHRPQATSDFTAWNASTSNIPYGFPGNLQIGGHSWPVLSTSGGHPVLGALGSLNTYDQWTDRDVLPAQHRVSGTGHLSFDLGSGRAWSRVWVSDRQARMGEPGALSDIVIPVSNPGYLNPLGGIDPVTLTYGFTDVLGPIRIDDRIVSGSVSIGVEYPWNGWSMDAWGSLSYERGQQLESNSINSVALAQSVNSTDPLRVFNPFSSSTQASIADFRQALRYESHSRLEQAQLTALHDLVSFPGGESAVTIGAEVRRESLSSMFAPGTVYTHLERDSRTITGAFAQIGVPLISAKNQLAFARHIDLTLGERLERYSQGGHSWSPKISGAWSIVDPWSLRASWGRAFRAPALTERQNTDDVTYAYQGALIRTGGNSDLRPESSRTSTVGMDYAAQGVSFSATYFAIVSRARVLQPQYNGTLTGFDGAVITNPSPSQRQLACQYFFGDTPQSCERMAVQAIIDDRLQNLQTLRTSGVDASIHYEVRDLDIRVDLTRVLSYQQQSSVGPLVNLLDTPNYPIRLRTRASISRPVVHGLSANLAVNYTSGYEDTNIVPARSIGAWTTFDVGLEYLSSGGVRASVAVRNLMDRMPPFVADTQTGAAWDSANAGNLIGRTITVGVQSTVR